MILKLFKFFFKLLFIILIAAILFVSVVIGIGRSAKGYVESSELPYDNVTYMMQSYEKNAEAAPGTWCACPVCGTKYFYKEDIPCCSRECEKKYHEIVNAWRRGDKNLVESYGKKAK